MNAQLHRRFEAITPANDLDLPVAEPAPAPENDAAADPRLPFRTVLLSIIGLWLCYYALITLRSALVDNHYFLEMASGRLLVGLAGIAVTLMSWAVLRLFDQQRLWLRIGVALAIMLPAALLLALVNQQVFAKLDAQILGADPQSGSMNVRHDTAGNMLVDMPDPPGLTKDQLAKLQATMSEQALWRQTTDIAIGRYFLLLAWAALYFALVNAEEARAAERSVGAARRAAKAAELRSLRYQINPHFLFNTLNSLSALVMTGKTESAEAMIQTLSVFYRRSLAGDPTGDMTLAEEIALQRLYLDIEVVRFPERLRTNFEIPDTLAQALVPGMILQPLIENSVKYAVAATNAAVTVTIEAREEYGRLAIVVSDDGPGGGSAQHGCGIGIANVRERLATRFGADASLDSGPGESGWRTVIRMPLVRHHG